MSYSLPTNDDTPIWNTWLASFQLPALTVALELELFEALNEQPASAEDFSERMDLNKRVMKALLPMLMQQGYLVQHGQTFQLTPVAKDYLLKDSPFFWGKHLSRAALQLNTHTQLLQALKNTLQASPSPAADAWESGQMTEEMAQQITAFMHCHSLAPAVALAKMGFFKEVSKLLDVGGGSGCFPIAFASEHPDFQGTVMDLKPVCEVSKSYIADAGVSAQVDTQAVDMFREAWPKGYDSIFFANVFHDWDFPTCATLAKHAFDALPSGGKVFLHEMLLNDSATGPAPAVAFSLLMGFGTMGQQFTFDELKTLLNDAGFKDVSSRPTYGYYSLVIGVKP